MILGEIKLLNSVNHLRPRAEGLGLKFLSNLLEILTILLHWKPFSVKIGQLLVSTCRSQLVIEVIRTGLQLVWLFPRVNAG